MMQVDRRDKYQQMHALLNEKQWRQYLALEAKERGSVAQVAQEAQVSQNTIRRGIREVEAGEGYTPGERQRPATSKWNKIEHRLFSFISIHWRAKPLPSLEVVLELISHTTTNEGLMVTAVKDSQTYPTGLKVTDEELAALHLFREPFHGEWNYTIKPQES
jgi:Rhodopirellula transposase DDE domain